MLFRGGMSSEQRTEGRIGQKSLPLSQSVPAKSADSLSGLPQ